ncbi:MAG: outer membrane protein assembly factor BamA [Balneolaceae bacterium]|nr:outer membrane protein assembly factor BamA [Balneolaceae bacterium]
MFLPLKRILFATLLIIGFGFTPGISAAQDTFEIEDPTDVNPQEYEILSVEVEGNESTRAQFVENASSLQEGSTIVYPGDAIPQAVKRLYRSGLFSDIKIFVKEKSLSGIRLLIRVVEQPKIYDFKIEGVKRSQRKDLEDLIVLRPGTAITDAAIGQAKNTINRFYKQKGYWYTQVDVRTDSVEGVYNRERLVFDIDAGKRLEVKDIIFEGNEQLSNRKLTKKMKPLKKDAWWRIFGKKVFKESDFEEGKSKVLAHYRENGYTDARILSDSVYTFTYDGDKEGVKVLINIEEGPQYKIRNINWDGNTVYEDEVLTQVLGFEKGDTYNERKFQQNLRGTESSVDAFYKNNGYLFFQAYPNFTRVEGDSLDVYFEVYEDEIATIEKVSFTGNTRTHDDVVRRTLRTVPGATYSQQDVIRTIRELGTLGYFDPANIIPDMVPNSQEKTVDIEYVLDDTKSTSNFEFSGGYGGSGIGVIVSARMNFNNFSVQRMFKKGGWAPIPSGDGQKLSLGVQVTGKGYQSYSFGFTEPWFKGRPTSVGLNVSYNLVENRITDQTNELFSSTISLGKRLKWPDDYFSTQTSVGYQRYNFSGTDDVFAEGASNLITIRQVLERNSVVNPISPILGSKLSLSFEFAPPMPGFAEYYKIKTGFQHHVPLTDKLILTSTVDYGYIGYFTKDKRSTLNRFLVGGTQLQQRQSFNYDNIDMRGYPGGRQNSIAPVVNGVQIGGRIYNKYSLELRYPAITNDQVQVIPYTFVDAGNSYLDFEHFDPFELKRSAGFGTRLYLPILGLIDLSYGYRFDGVRGTSIAPGNWEFLFNIGAPF